MSPQKAQKRQEIVNFFKQTALQENQKQQKIDFGDLLNKNDKGRVLFCLPESAGDIFLATSLLKSVKSRYPDWTLYVATKPEYREILDGNPYVDKWIEWQPIFNNHIWLTGNNVHNGYFNVAYDVASATQKLLNYYHDGGKDKIDLNLR